MIEGFDTGKMLIIGIPILIVAYFLIKWSMEATRDVFYTDRDEDAG